MCLISAEGSVRFGFCRTCSGFGRSLIIYGPNSVGREKSAWNGVNLPALQESPSPNGWSGNLLLLVHWLSMVCKYLTEFSSSWDHFKVPNRFIEFSGKNCLKQIFHFTQFDTTTKIKSVGHLPLSVNFTSAPTYHLTTANDHSQPGLHDFGCGVKLCKIENLPQTRFSRKVNKTVWHFKMVSGRWKFCQTLANHRSPIY